MPHVARAALNGASTIVKADVDADDASIIQNGGALNASSIRPGARFDFQRLEFPFTRQVSSHYYGHRYSISDYSGSGRPIVMTGPRAADLTLSSGDMPANYKEIEHRANNFIDVVDYFPVPSWSNGLAATPLLRLESLAVTVSLIVHDQSLEGDGIKQFATDADVAAALTVNVYRLPSSKLRAYRYPPATAFTLRARYVWQADPSVDLSLVATKAGMIARPRRRANVDNMTGSGYMTSDTAGPAFGSLAGEAFANFQALALLDGANIVQSHTLAPDDLLIVSVTGTDRLIYGGEASFKPDHRTIVLPVRGAWSVPVFADVEFCT